LVIFSSVGKVKPPMQPLTALVPVFVMVASTVKPGRSQGAASPRSEPGGLVQKAGRSPSPLSESGRWTWSVQQCQDAWPPRQPAVGTAGVRVLAQVEELPAAGVDGHSQVRVVTDQIAEPPRPAMAENVDNARAPLGAGDVEPTLLRAGGAPGAIGDAGGWEEVPLVGATPIAVLDDAVPVGLGDIKATPTATMTVTTTTAQTPRRADNR
jgi:hypothetical protein